MQLVCPSCAAEFPIEAGFSDAEGKRLAALFAGMEPALGRAVLPYLRLFKPAKTALRTSRALRLVGDLLELVEAGDVCRDERSGIRRPATPALWTVGIEQMLAQRDRLELPLQNHHYLRAIVFALADQAEAARERRTEEDRRAGRHRQAAGVGVVALPATSPQLTLANEVDYARRMHEYGQFTEAQRDEHIERAKARLQEGT